MKTEEIEGIENLATKDDLRVLAAELKAEMAQIRAAISELKAELLKWMIGIQLTFAALIVVLSHWKA